MAKLLFQRALAGDAEAIVACHSMYGKAEYERKVANKKKRDERRKAHVEKVQP